jgi:hypothetical protein
MPWDQRGEKRYYYRYSWQNGRAVRIYCGTGEIAELAATADALLQVQREMDARKWKQEQKRRAAAEALLEELSKQADLLARATLIVAGFHQHNRSAWRLKRVQPTSDRET